MDNCSAHPQELKSIDGSNPLHGSSSKHNFMDSAYGSTSLAGSQEPLKRETSSKNYHKLRC